mgnify:CR=1 FL=1
MIRIENVSKSFDNLQILKGVLLNIEKGEIFGIAGRSGVGKSTLLRCVNGLEQYNSGSIKVDGAEVGSLSPEELRLFRKNVGMVFQNFSLVTRASVYENIAFAMKIWNCDKNRIDRRVKELLEVVGIPEKINARARDLSGGQKQRVALARALAMNPSVLLCDEATSALDPKSTIDILSLLDEINKNFNITIVMVTHEMEVIKTLCDSMAVMANGNVEATGSVEQVFLERPPALCDLLGEAPMKLRDEETLFDIQIDEEKGDATLLTSMARSLGVDFRFADNQKLSLKNKTVDTFRILADRVDAAAITKYLDMRSITYKRFPEVI